VIGISTSQIESATPFMEGGALPIPILAEWDHPEIREKRKIHGIFLREMNEVLAASINNLSLSHSGVGIPPGSFCFDPASSIDETWNAPPYEEWEAQIEGEIPVQLTSENSTPLPSPVTQQHKQRSSVAADSSDSATIIGRSHRLSIDALRAFA